MDRAAAEQRAFQGRVALVTGATSGIGLELARALTRQGARVIGTGRDQGRLMALGREIELALSLDLREDRAVAMAADTVLDRFGRVDILVNNAGVGLFLDVHQTTLDDIERLMDLNLYGAVRLSRALLPGMIERRQGLVVNIASVAGERGYAKHTAYCASKHALIGWSRALRKDLRGTGVDVVVVCPPAVDTPFFANAGFHDYKAAHPGLALMSATRVAEETLRAMAQRRPQVILSPRARLLWLLDKLAPPLVDRLQGWKEHR